MARGIETSSNASLHWPVEANEVFMKAAPETLAHLKSAGFEFHVWPGHDDLARLVCSWATSEEEVRQFLETLNSR